MPWDPLSSGERIQTYIIIHDMLYAIHVLHVQVIELKLKLSLVYYLFSLAKLIILPTALHHYNFNRVHCQSLCIIFVLFTMKVKHPRRDVWH